MLIGIIADSHDNITKIKEVVEALNQRNVGYVIHCGDFIAPFSLEPIKNLKCDWAGVFGNNDGERRGLFEKSEWKIKEPPYFLELSGVKIAVVHKFIPVGARVICHGHTHQPQIKEEDGKLLINPGEVCGWLTGKSSFAVLDTDTMKAEIIYF